MFFFSHLWYVFLTNSYAETYLYFETNSNESLIKNTLSETERLFRKRHLVQIAIKSRIPKTEEDASLQSSEDIEDPQIDPVQTMEYLNQLNEGVGFINQESVQMPSQRFLSLSMLPEVPNDIRQESIVYIAEILYIQGDKESANDFFEQLLMDDPKYQIDRFRHPPDVCGYFDFVNPIPNNSHQKKNQ